MVIQDNTKTGYYMVRAMGQTEKDFNIFFEGNVVAVGWSKVVFSKVEDPETLVEQVKKNILLKYRLCSSIHWYKTK